MMASTSLWLGGTILIAAGTWQLTPIKNPRLRHCRSPPSFLAGSWRPGSSGAFRMGLEHGAYCLGCCWFLMGLLFFGGIMNLYWIAGREDGADGAMVRAGSRRGFCGLGRGLARQCGLTETTTLESQG